MPGGYIAFVEEIPGANTQGATLANARENLKEGGEHAAGELPRFWADLGVQRVLQYDKDMKVISGTVLGGKVEVPKDTFAEGDRVAIVATEPAEPIQLTPEQEAELVAAVDLAPSGRRSGRSAPGQRARGVLKKDTRFLAGNGAGEHSEYNPIR